MATTKDVLVYDVHYKTKLPYPHTRIYYHQRCVVADNEDMAVEILKGVVGRDLVVTHIKLLCSAIEEVR